MLKFLKNIFSQNACKLNGVCSIHPSINALSELLIEEVREISFYLVKLKEFNIQNSEIMALCAQTLSVFMLNTNFSKSDYLELLNKLYSSKIDVKEKYLAYCSKFQIPCEVINSEFVISKNTDLSQLIEHSQNAIEKKQRNYDKNKQNLFDLITIFAKLSAINIVKIKKFQKDFTDFDYKLLRFFSLTNSYSIRKEKLTRKILEFCEISKEIRHKLNSLLEENFGKIETTSINTSLQEGHSILVSGDDLDELRDILETIEKNYKDENINVYTHGSLIKAHFYPYFKNSKFLKGHFGQDDVEYDFPSFEGAILVTQNFIQKIDNIYKGEIFSNKLISFEKLHKIENGDFSPLIEASLNLKTSSFENIEEKKETETLVEHNIEKVKKLIQEFSEKEIIIALGGIQKRFYLSDWEGKKVIGINCAFEGDLLEKIIENFTPKNIKITLFVVNCDLISFDTLLNNLNQNLEIYLADCSNILVNPHAIFALRDEFKIKTI